MLPEPEIFDQPWSNSNVVFIVDKKQVHCHTQILGANSGVLAQMLSERPLHQLTDPFYIGEVKHYIFVKFLIKLYSKKLFPIGFEEALELIDLFQKYEVDSWAQNATNALERAYNEGNISCVEAVAVATRCQLWQLEWEATKELLRLYSTRRLLKNTDYDKLTEADRLHVLETLVRNEPEADVFLKVTSGPQLGCYVLAKKFYLFVICLLVFAIYVLYDIITVHDPFSVVLYVGLGGLLLFWVITLVYEKYTGVKKPANRTA